MRKAENPQTSSRLSRWYRYQTTICRLMLNSCLFNNIEACLSLTSIFTSISLPGWRFVRHRPPGMIVWHGKHKFHPQHRADQTLVVQALKLDRLDRPGGGEKAVQVVKAGSGAPDQNGHRKHQHQENPSSRGVHRLTSIEKGAPTDTPVCCLPSLKIMPISPRSLDWTGTVLAGIVGEHRRQDIG